MLGVIEELVAPAAAGTPSWPSETKYVFAAVHSPGIRLGAPGVGVVPDYGRPVYADEAKLSAE
jgi:hypothetical protein